MKWVKIIHPGTGNTAEVAPESLRHYYPSGWRLLAEDEEPQPEPEPEPAPVTQAQVTEALASSESEEE